MLRSPIMKHQNERQSPAVSSAFASSFSSEPRSILFYNQILFQNTIFIYSNYWTTWALTGALMIVHCGRFHRPHDWYCIWWWTCWFESTWLTFKGVHILLNMAGTKGGILLWHKQQVWYGIPSRWPFRPESNEQQQQHQCEWWRQRKEEIHSILRWCNPQQK